MKNPPHPKPTSEQALSDLADAITTGLRKEGLSVKCRSKRQRYKADYNIACFLTKTLSSHFNIDIDAWEQAAFEKLEHTIWGYPKTPTTTTTTEEKTTT
jgi:hypothetical protein